MGKIWAVCSASGGAGKSTIAASLASRAAKAGKKTILLDASGISHCCDLLLGMESVVVLDMADVIKSQIRIEDALYPVPEYALLQFASASLYEGIPVCDLSGVILALHSMCEILIIDLPTGQIDLGRGVLRKGDERLLIVRPDDASIRAAERLLTQASGYDEAATALVVNRIDRDLVKKKVQYAADVVQGLLDQAAAAIIPEDASISGCILQNRFTIDTFGSASSSLNNLAKKLLSGA